VIPLIASFLLLIDTNITNAEIVTFGKRFFADRSTIRGELYTTSKELGETIGVNVALGEPKVVTISGVVTSFVLQFRCKDKWNWEKAEKAANSIAQHINKNNNIDPLKMLSEAGLSGCDYTQ